MKTVGIKELKAHTTEILQEVALGGEKVAVTHYGRVLAHIVPPTRARTPEEMARLQAEVERIREAVARAHPGPVDAVELVREGRRW